MTTPLRFTLLFLLLGVAFLPGAEKPNVLLITVDDMSCDSVGAFGCELPGTTPHIDRLASEGLRFHYAHVQVGNCYPSRNVLFSGRYPHNSGVEGFFQVKPIDYPVLCDLMKEGGYYTAIRGKVNHSTPYQPYAWDDDLTLAPEGGSYHLKDVESYYQCVAAGIAKAKATGKPFCLNINISDPHKPFWKPNDRHPSSRIFTADEVPVPGFLFDHPAVREELALYYTSVRRADDAVGAILRALRESSQEENTIVMFLSDHGMPLPFAKTQLWHHSTRTPWIVKWPGTTKAGTVDRMHMISAIDFLPTLLDIAGLAHPDGLEGRSFHSLLKGGSQEGRDAIFKVYNENAARNRHPMRAVETQDYLYIFNPWSDGSYQFRNATQGTATYRLMKKLAPERPELAARLQLIDYRELEELYKVADDPDCLVNLVDQPEHAEALVEHRRLMENFMRDSNDHALAPFLGREDPSARQAYMAKQHQLSAQRRSERLRKRAAQGKQKAAP